MKKQNIFLITCTLISIFISCFLYITRFYYYDNILTIIGTVLILLITMSNDIFRITNNKKLLFIIKNLHVLGISSFLLILPHTGETGEITRRIADNEIDYTIIYLVVPIIAFIVLLIMTLTSVENYQPKWWKKFHRIVWISLPFISLHLWLVNYKLLSALFLSVMLLPIIGLVLNNRNKKVYFNQIMMLLFGIFTMYITLYHTSLVVLFINYSLVIIPLLLLVVSIYFAKDKDLKKTLYKYFLYLIIIIIFLGVL